jgi:hypothetical protein
VDVTDWEPATDAELAMRDALRTDDQESYFRILAGLDLLLPVSADALAGLVPLGWGAWSTGGRTHVLAFTSPSALQACLADYTGSARRISYQDLANTWPNLEWWLAVNPGLPIEGYLPAWFVAQLARGDLRLPVRPAERDQAGASGNDNAAVPPPAQRPPAVAAAATAASGPAAQDRAPTRTTEGGLPMRTPGRAAADLSARHSPASPAVPAAQAAAEQAAAAQAFAAQVSAAPTSAVPASYRLPAPVPSAPPVRTTAQTPAEQRHPATPDQQAPTQQQATAQVPAAPRPADPGAPPSAAPVQPTPGGPLPRRPVTSPSERPTSMAAAAQAIASARVPQPAPQAAAGGLAPPVIPGSTAGLERPPTGGPNSRIPAVAPSTVPQPASRPGIPPASSGSARFGSAPPPEDPDDEFQPANEVEQDLYAAADGGSTDAFLSTLLLSTVLVPVAADSRPGTLPGDDGFAFRTEDYDGECHLVVFTSPDRLADHHPEPVRTVGVRFLQLIRNWPDESWAFAVNPGSPVGAKLPGAQIVALSSWATEAGLGTDPMPAPQEPAAVPVPAPRESSDAANLPTIMQKTLPPDQIEYFLDRGYDRVSGFVHRAHEVEHLRSPAALHSALGLGYAGSPYQADAKEAFLLRWPAYRPSLYRIPYGGQTEPALRAMDGWVIERAPFRGNGFAPGEGQDVIAEFKVDSARLPHGAELWRIDADGEERMIATFDCDVPMWRRVGGQ